MPACYTREKISIIGISSSYLTHGHSFSPQDLICVRKVSKYKIKNIEILRTYLCNMAHGTRKG